MIPGRGPVGLLVEGVRGRIGRALRFLPAGSYARADEGGGRPWARVAGGRGQAKPAVSPHADSRAHLVCLMYGHARPFMVPRPLYRVLPLRGSDLTSVEGFCFVCLPKLGLQPEAGPDPRIQRLPQALTLTCHPSNGIVWACAAAVRGASQRFPPGLLWPPRPTPRKPCPVCCWTRRLLIKQSHLPH